MADPIVESAATAEQQAKAEALGWIPPARFKGDAEKFVDADAYIERGETLLPIVKATNKRLEADLARVSAESVANAKALKTAQDAIEEMQERHSVETVRAAENARKQLVAQLAAASEAGDHEAVAQLTNSLVELKAAAAEVKETKDTKETKEVKDTTVTVPPDLLEWQRENPWYGTDKKKTNRALLIAQELRDDGEGSTGKVFFNKVKAALNKELGEDDDAADDKVASGRNGTGDGGNNGRAGKGKGYANLPAEAKAACDADARNFVGPNKKYKTPADWRARYAEIYFEDRG